jgi:cold shock CspA family protein
MAPVIRATVKQWNDDEGWGVLTAPDVAEDIWAHFSAMSGDGARSVEVGETVAVVVVDRDGPIQDGYRYRAERIVPDAQQ